MSTQKMFFAGTGGQGVLLMGQIVGSAALLENKEVTFFPSYGPEMRGGTANCTVIVSDKPISSPLIFESDVVVAMNPPSMFKFEPTLKPGGILILNRSLIQQDPKRSDIKVVDVQAIGLAQELGNARAANIVVLGAFVRTTNIVSSESVEKVIREVFGAKKAELVDFNIKAFNYWQQ